MISGTACAVDPAKESDDLDDDGHLCLFRFGEAELAIVESVLGDHRPWRTCQRVRVGHLSCSPCVDPDLLNDVWMTMSVVVAEEMLQMRMMMTTM